MYSVNRNSRYYLIDYQVPQGTPEAPPVLEVVEVTDYKGQLIILGIKHAHQQHVFAKGFETIGSHPSVSVVLPYETTENVASINTFLAKGRKITLRPILAISDELDIPVVTWSRRMGRLWQPVDYFDPAERLERAKMVIDVYLDWKQTGAWPEWFRRAKLAQTAAAG